MSRPFRFRYVNELVGGLILVVLALVVAAVVLAAQAQRWFEPVHTLRCTFPPEGTFGLQKGNEIEILGTRVGTVDRILVDEEGTMAAELRIRGDFIRFVRADSVAVVRKKFGVAGDAYVAITPGKGGALDWGGEPEVPIRKDTEVTELLQSLLERVQGAVLPALEELTKALTEYRMLAADLRDPGGDLQKAIGHLNGIAHGLEQGEGALGRLLRDPETSEQTRRMFEQVNGLLADLRGTSKELESVVRDLRVTSASLPGIAKNVEGEARDLPGLVLQVQATLREAEQSLAAVQRHWLLRSYVRPDDPIGTVPPDAVAPATREDRP